MQKLSGLILDKYDDLDGSLFDVSMIGYTKVARVLTPEERSRLPDDSFALILSDGDLELRKFSMADRGNVGLSVTYFLKTGHKLPVEAQKVAAENLLRGCECFGINPPKDLQKIALGIGSLIGGALVVPGAVREASNNLKAVQGAGGIMTPEQIKQRRLQMGV